jgi:hypothetical protein
MRSQQNIKFFYILLEMDLTWLWCSSKMYPIEKRALTLNTKQAAWQNVVEHIVKETLLKSAVHKEHI